MNSVRETWWTSDQCKDILMGLDANVLNCSDVAMMCVANLHTFQWELKENN